MAEIDLTPTEQMASNAARGLELREKHGKGGTAVGVARARDIKNRKNLSPETVRRMHSFFSRHEGNQAGGEDDAGYIAWLLWGGDAGKSWAARKSAQLDKKEENAMHSETYKAIASRLGMAARAGAKANFALEDVISDAKSAIKHNEPDAADWVNHATKAMKQYNLASDDRAWSLYESLIASAKRAGIKINPPVTKAARPGAKAVMAMTVAQAEQIINTIDERKASQTSWSPAMDHLTKQRDFAQRLIVAHRQGDTANIKRYSALLEKAGWARPGAKSRHAADILKVEVMDGSTVTSSMSPSDFMAYAKRSLPGIGSTSSLPDMISRFNELAEEKGMRVRVQSNLAKSKHAIREGDKVSAADDAVSRKIRKLMDEGKPQKQAVAIALDLERRGEL